MLRAVFEGTQCDNWMGMEPRYAVRCTNDASGWMFKGGKQIPGGPVCSECGNRMVTTYGEKLLQTDWEFRPVEVRNW